MRTTSRPAFTLFQLLNVSTALRVCLSANYRLGVLPTSIQPFLR